MNRNSSLLPSAGIFASALAACLFASGCGKKQEAPVTKEQTKATENSEVAPKPAGTKPETKPAAKSDGKPAAAPAPDGASSSAFDKTLKLQGITFHVQCPNEGSLNNLTITPSGLELDNDPVKLKEIDGSVIGAEVGDLNGDGSPEIYIYVQSAGSGSYGTLIAYSANNKKSITPITLPELDDKLAKGYMGHDEFSLVESTLARRFPIYKEADTNAAPTGGTRQISYKLKAGEAGWLLVVDKVSEH
jgi:hypothetical protein